MLGPPPASGIGPRSPVGGPLGPEPLSCDQCPGRYARVASEAGEPGARLAVDVHAHPLRREIAAMAAAMNGLDVLVFTGGIGEHQPAVRAEAAAGLSFLGVAIDPARNTAASADAEITAAGAAVRTLVLTAREDIEVAQQARAVLPAVAA